MQLTELQTESANYMHGVRIAAVAKNRYMDLYTPSNLAVEKAKFLNGDTDAPDFAYPDILDGWSSALSDALTKAREIEFPSVFSDLIEADLLHLMEEVKAFSSHKSFEIEKVRSARYPSPSEELLRAARELIEVEQIDEKSVGQFDSATAVDLFNRAFEHLGIDNWAARVEPEMAARMSVNASSGLVRIRNGIILAEPELRRLFVHELGTHVFRSINGGSHKLKVFATGTGAYTSTEEGFAVFNEQKAGLLASADLRRYALRVVAASLAKDHSFRDVFESIRGYTNDSEAFDIAIRSKRGMADLEEPGADNKDCVYLSGWRDVSAAAESNPDISTVLMLGKFGLQHLELIQGAIEAGYMDPDPVVSQEGALRVVDELLAA